MLIREISSQYKIHAEDKAETTGPQAFEAQWYSSKGIESLRPPVSKPQKRQDRMLEKMIEFHPPPLRNELLHTHAIPFRIDTLGLAFRICFHSGPGSCFSFSAFLPIVPRDSPVTPNICSMEKMIPKGMPHSHLRVAIDFEASWAVGVRGGVTLICLSLVGIYSVTRVVTGYLCDRWIVGRP